MKEVLNKRFYPQNYILHKTGTEDLVIKQLSENAKKVAPDMFDAEVTCFDFILRYQPPYSDFSELKRLQYEAIKRTRFKDEYHGFIAIDLSEWENHFDEEFFSIALTFLNDMSESWKYIFLLDEKTKSTDFSNALYKSAPSLRTLEIDSSTISQNSFDEVLIDEITNKYKKVLSPSAKNLLKKVFNSRAYINTEEISNVAKDLSVYFFEKVQITDSLLTEYILNEFTYLHFIMTKSEKKNLGDILESEKKI